MNVAAVQRVLGMLLMIFSIAMLPPAGVAMLYGDGEYDTFLKGFLVVFIIGALVWLPVRGVHRDLRRRDGALIVALFWSVLGTAGAVPLLFSGSLALSVTDAVFVSIAALTTTGSELIVGLDVLPESILFYRQWLQWLGGMGIIVLAVAILPLLGVGGMQLYRAETPGPTKDTKLTPRITETAKTLWFIYVLFTVVCAIAYRIAGMNGFDAVSHAFSTVSLGGLSTHDLNIGYFANTAVEYVAMVFMVLGGVNFALHFQAFQRGSLKHYWRDPEFRAYILLLFWLMVFVAAWLSVSSHHDDTGLSIRHGMFHVVSIMTTSGFAADNFAGWPAMLPVLLILSSFIGACAYSTGGGMKVIRWLLLAKQGVREMRRLVHPHAQFAAKMGDRAVPERIVSAVWGFFSMYVVVFALLMIVCMALGLDHVTAFSAVAACLNNLGPGLGDVATNYAGIPDASKWVLMLAMLLGRLEIFTLLILFTPAFWKK